jgi:hypothetical protein
VSLGLRVTAELKRKLDEAAANSGRSQSQEAELRLERSFERDHLSAEIRKTMSIEWSKISELWSKHLSKFEGESHDRPINSKELKSRSPSHERQHHPTRKK